MEVTSMSVNRRMDKENVVHSYNEILPSHKKNEIMPLSALWIDLEIIKLSEASQTERQHHMILFICEI